MCPSIEKISYQYGINFVHSRFHFRENTTKEIKRNISRTCKATIELITPDTKDRPIELPASAVEWPWLVQANSRDQANDRSINQPTPGSGISQTSFDGNLRRALAVIKGKAEQTDTYGGRAWRKQTLTT